MRLAMELRSFIDTANAPIFGIDAQVASLSLSPTMSLSPPMVNLSLYL